MVRAGRSGGSGRLQIVTGIEQRNRKDHPSERAVNRKPGFAGRRFRNSLQIRPHSEHYLEQIQASRGTNRGLRFASLGRPLAIAPVSGPGAAVDRGAEMAVQEDDFKGLPAGLHVGDDPFPFSRANKQFSPLDDDNARPELRRSGHGQFAATGSSVASLWQAEEPVSQLINDFGPPVASPAAARQRASMPFVHLERELWDLRDAAGREIAPDAPERRGWLLERGAVGRLQVAVEQLLADPGTLAAAVRLLLDRHFTPVLAELICSAVDLDVPALDLAGSGGTAQAGARAAAPRVRRRGPARLRLSVRDVRIRWCAGRYPVGIQAAHGVLRLWVCSSHRKAWPRTRGYLSKRRWLFFFLAPAGSAPLASFAVLLAGLPGQLDQPVPFGPGHAVQLEKGPKVPGLGAAPSGLDAEGGLGGMTAWPLPWPPRPRIRRGSSSVSAELTTW